MFGESVCHDRLLTINKVLDLHAITNLVWHSQLILDNMSTYINNWENLPNVPVLQRQLLLTQRLPTIGHDYIFDGTWDYTYQLFKYTQTLESYRNMSGSYYCPYSLQLNVFPIITYYDDNRSHKVILPVKLRVFCSKMNHDNRLNISKTDGNTSMLKNQILLL